MSQTFLNYFSSLTGIRKLQDQSAILTAPTLELLDQSSSSAMDINYTINLER